jgi:hypothetical protein
MGGDVRIPTEGLFIKVWWRFYKFNSKEYAKTVLYILENPPLKIFNFYFI